MGKWRILFQHPKMLLTLHSWLNPNKTAQQVNEGAFFVINFKTEIDNPVLLIFNIKVLTSHLIFSYPKNLSISNNSLEIPHQCYPSAFFLETLYYQITNDFIFLMLLMQMLCEIPSCIGHVCCCKPKYCLSQNFSSRYWSPLKRNYHYSPSIGGKQKGELTCPNPIAKQGKHYLLWCHYSCPLGCTVSCVWNINYITLKYSTSY